MVLHWGERALAAVRHFEQVDQRGLSVHTFRKLQAVHDPAFLESVMAVMTAPKPSVGQFMAEVTRVARQQWYHWHVMHPQMPVHAERSMHLNETYHV